MTVKAIARVIAGACLLVGLVVATRPDVEPPTADALGYLDFAMSVAEHGVFGRWQGPDAPPEPSGWLMPLYPAMQALALLALPDLAKATRCYVDRRPAATCPPGLNLQKLVAVPFALVLALAVWWLAWLVTGRPAAAWIAMVAVFLAEWPVKATTVFLTEGPVLAFGALFLCALARVVQTRAVGWAAVAGLLLGLMALTRPGYVYLYWFLLPLALWAGVCIKKPSCAALLWGGFTLAFVAVCLPWMLRNSMTIGEFTLTAGSYGALSLSHRLGFNEMSPMQWLAAFVFWFPDFGDDLATTLFGSTTVAPLTWDKPASFYLYGAGPFYRETLAAAGGTESHAGYLLRRHVLGDPLTHAAVTLPLAWRGMLMGYWSVVGLICLAIYLRVDRGRRRAALHAVLFAALVMVFFHAAVSVSIPRYNTLLVPILAVAIGWAGARLLDRFARRPRAPA